MFALLGIIDCTRLPDYAYLDLSEVINDDKMKILARDIAKKIENELDYPGQIKVSVIRESRTIDYAK